ncbi:MAG: hypothetical protein HY902_04565 [Deltaproteobacteria bacterium]|nr:hypothetical protein [Deltaproteobacteria bacterium]
MTRVAIAALIPLAVACAQAPTYGGPGAQASDSGLGGLFQDAGGDGLGAADTKGDGAPTGKADSGGTPDSGAAVDAKGDAPTDLGPSDVAPDTGLDAVPDSGSDAGSKPDGGSDSAGDGSGCTGDSQCPGSGPCKVGLCEKGQCVVTPVYGCCESGPCCDLQTNQAKVQGSPCDGPALAVEYGCQGQDMLMRSQVAGCDGVTILACSSDAAVWGAWQKTGACAGDGQCVLLSTKQKPQCSSGGPPQCTSDAGCDDGDPCTKNKCVGFACQPPQVVAGAVCSSTASAAEYKCQGTGPGSDVQVRKGFPTCTAAGACTADAPSWGSWTTEKMCNYNEVCEVTDPTKPGSCVPAPECTPGSTCCTAQGKYAAEATPCGTAIVDTQFECTGVLGGTIRKRDAVAGCAGGMAWCSSSYPAWGAWADVKTCPPLQACTPSWSDAYQPTCESQCKAGNTCCSADGTYSPQATACGFGTVDTEEKCSGPEKGGKILERKATCGCTGTSTSCSCSTANYAWGDWTPKKTCLASEVCEISYGYASCVPYQKCTPNTTCCDADGQYAAKTVACGTSIADTQYQCLGSGLGAAMQKRDAHYGCSGTSTSCSYAGADYVWGDWTTIKTCPANQYCKLYYDSMQPSCTTTP